ncbi:MAG: TIGR00282 family metallophosphoesterase [Thermoleophilia bacterium]|nr:TIGR00282 family metallophosphoesterase [Thermoleophilia bacterium]PHX81105.1 MAG: TIGR00282 family metallophosphoesterase [Thermoleophilia bacterium]
MRILFLADVYGAPGVSAIESKLRLLRAELELDCVVINAENAADGVGLTPKLAERLLAAGADCLTLGNHLWRRKEIGPYLIEAERVVRPANLLDKLPGRGLQVVTASNGQQVAVINLLGSFTMEPAQSMFSVVDGLLDEAHRSTPIVLVDVHAEATSEKVAMGWHLAGRATAVIGTHTHVQTSDARVLPGGTAYITDAGMTGPHDSVIGAKKELSLRRFLLQQPQRLEPASEDVRLEGVLMTCDDDGRATSIEAFRRNA